MDNLAYEYTEPKRTEMHDGRIVLMAPQPSTPHNDAADNIRYNLRRRLEGKNCTVVSSETAVHFDDKNYVVPDVMIVCDKKKIKYNGIHGAPDLVAEVLSPGSKKYDRGHKMEQYSRHGVREYWLVNPIGRTVEVYLPGDGGLEMNEIYEFYPEHILNEMDGDELAEIKTEIPVSFLPDVKLKLDEIFSYSFD